MESRWSGAPCASVSRLEPRSWRSVLLLFDHSAVHPGEASEVFNRGNPKQTTNVASLCGDTWIKAFLRVKKKVSRFNLILRYSLLTMLPLAGLQMLNIYIKKKL